jgi:hypothetical protein
VVAHLNLAAASLALSEKVRVKERKGEKAMINY